MENINERKGEKFCRRENIMRRCPLHDPTL